MKRKLTNEEMGHCAKSLKAKEEEMEWINYQLSYYDLMLDNGLEMNYKKNIRDFKGYKRDFEGQKKVIQEGVRILKDQMRNGVEIKNKVVDFENKVEDFKNKVVDFENKVEKEDKVKNFDNK